VLHGLEAVSYWLKPDLLQRFHSGPFPVNMLTEPRAKENEAQYFARSVVENNKTCNKNWNVF
jgi:hypothetical protein